MAASQDILNEMLDSVSDSYDKKIGSFIYDSLAPVAEQLVTIDAQIEQTIDKMSISNLSGAELAQRVRERTGIERKAATYAIGEVVVTGTGTINKGDLFETSEGIQFKATETKVITTTGTVNIQALVSGDIGNVSANTIILFPVTLAGFTAVNNPSPTGDGFEAESDADLLSRYFDRIQTPSTSGNKNQFRNWAKEVNGVGDAKVIPLWDGDNTVKIIIINSARQPSSSELVETVQNYIDPDSSGTGDGVAPIGAYVTVVSADGVEIDIKADITLSAGFTQQQVTDNFTDELIKYLVSVAFVEDIVSYAKVGSLLLNTIGVEDYSNLTVNGGTSNIVIDIDEVAIAGDVTLNV